MLIFPILFFFVVDGIAVDVTVETNRLGQAAVRQWGARTKKLAHYVV